MRKIPTDQMRRKSCPSKYIFLPKDIPFSPEDDIQPVFRGKKLYRQHLYSLNVVRLLIHSMLHGECRIQTKTQTEHSILNAEGGKLAVIMTALIEVAFCGVGLWAMLWRRQWRCRWMGTHTRPTHLMLSLTLLGQQEGPDHGPSANAFLPALTQTARLLIYYIHHDRQKNWAQLL